VVRPFVNSAIVTLAASAISLALGSLAAYALSRYRIRLGFIKNGDFFFVCQRIMPPVVLVIPCPSRARRPPARDHR
jgi:multiple sugar transport system permease protein